MLIRLRGGPLDGETRDFLPGCPVLTVTMPDGSRCYYAADGEGVARYVEPGGE